MNFLKKCSTSTSSAKRLWRVFRHSPDRQFGLVFSVVFLIAGLFMWNADNNSYLVCYFLSLIFFVLTIVAPKMLSRLNVIWLRFGKILQLIISPLVMLMIYFLFITPYGLLIKLLGYRGQLKMSHHGQSSYWVARVELLVDEPFKNQF